MSSAVRRPASRGGCAAAAMARARRAAAAWLPRTKQKRRQKEGLPQARALHAGRLRPGCPAPSAAHAPRDAQLLRRQQAA
jgi:hypothetical protein